MISSGKSGLTTVWSMNKVQKKQDSSSVVSSLAELSRSCRATFLVQEPLAGGSGQPWVSKRSVG